MLRLLLLTIAVFAVIGDAHADVVPQRKWLEVRSPNFRVMGEVGAGTLRQVAERMEQLHAVLSQIAGGDTGAADVTVVVFKDQRSFQPFMPRYQNKTVSVAGYFLGGPMNYIAVVADRNYDYSDVVYHEYVHLASNRALGAMPPWLAEGLAEFYSTFEPADGGKKARVGTPHEWHLRRLQREFLPLATLAAVTRDSPYYNERDKTSIFYAESWGFFHFLQIGLDRKYAPRLPSFVEALLDGMPFDRACVERLGTTSQALENELKQYFSSLFFKHLDVPLPETIERIERLPATPVSEGEAHAHLAHLSLAMEVETDARAHLDHAVAVEPTQPLALARLADLASIANDDEQAMALARRAGEAPAPTYLSQYFRASALERAIQNAGGDRSSVVAAWQAVVDLNPRFADGYARLAQARADAEQSLEDAKTAQERAIGLAPARLEYRLGLARILIMLGDTKSARGILGPLVARAPSPQLSAAARQYLGIAAQVELARTNGTAAPVPERPPDSLAEPPAVPTGDREGGGKPPAEAVENAKSNATANFERLLLRNVLDGETRIFGDMTAIECSADGASVVVGTGTGTTVRVRGGTLDNMDFVSYRSDIAGGISCGPQSQALPVLVTYRPEPANGTVGEVVIVEVVPAGYKPKAP